MKAKHKVFETNKAQVVLYPMEGVHAAFLKVALRAGSWHEESNSWGAFHLLEHMVHQGTKKLPNMPSIELFKEEYGINSNAWTGNSDMGFWFEFPEANIKRALELFEEVVFNPTLPFDRLEKEVSVISQEYVDKWSSPHARFGRALDWQLLSSPSLKSFRDLLDLSFRLFCPAPPLVSV